MKDYTDKKYCVIEEKINAIAEAITDSEVTHKGYISDITGINVSLVNQLWTRTAIQEAILKLKERHQ